MHGGECQATTVPCLATSRSAHHVPASTEAMQTSLLVYLGYDIEHAEETKAWHHNNWVPCNVMFLSTAKAAASSLLRYKHEQVEIPDGTAAWDGMTAKHQNSTLQRRRIMKNRFVVTMMAEGRNSDVFTG